jgi:hypothetical protein
MEFGATSSSTTARSPSPQTSTKMRRPMVLLAARTFIPGETG